MNIKIIIVAFIYLMSLNSFGQNSESENVIGSTLIIQSEIMNDERGIQIFLPDSYLDSETKYPVLYILHQTVIVIIAYYVVRTNDVITLKLLFLTLVCFWICVLIYHLFIRPFNFMRFIFGMKQLHKKGD